MTGSFICSGLGLRFLRVAEYLRLRVLRTTSFLGSRILRAICFWVLVLVLALASVLFGTALFKVDSDFV